MLITLLAFANFPNRTSNANKDGEKEIDDGINEFVEHLAISYNITNLN